MKLVHHSPLGALEIPGVDGAPEPGEPFDVDDDLAQSLLEQSDLYAPAGPAELTVAELRDLARERDVDIAGLRSKADIAAAIDAATAQAAAPADASTQQGDDQ